ncbi:hypothetical protein HPB50_026320 [Hyalomma asiaticum]|uniref:Uncharacterized protein n=1 Tax=Hyalomma asiaticum TaxID=266040 RepID=A0ACB7SZ88_HYAAI|nr:hypothetical protein HPB50_026320 [Hyalomma asiaticum]
MLAKPNGIESHPNRGQSPVVGVIHSLREKKESMTRRICRRLRCVVFRAALFLVWSLLFLLVVFDLSFWAAVNASDSTYEDMCSARNRTVVLQEGDKFRLDPKGLLTAYNATVQDTKCNYSTISRDETAEIPDIRPILGAPRELLFGEPVDAEYVQVSCEARGKLLFTEYFLIPQPKQPVQDTDEPQPDEPPESRKMSVLLLGIDSTSRINFNRFMVKTRRYIIEELGAFELLGFNKVGDNSFPNQLPLLSGFSGPDAESLFKRHNFDTFPLLWNTFRLEGYTTLFLEEMPYYGLMSEIGRHEDKTPFCFLMLPKRFLREYPQAVVQLEVNQRRLVTPYDLHATLLSLPKLPAFNPEPTNKGLNLFGEIPPERTCADAFIAPEFCACTGSASDTLDPGVMLSFSRYAVSYINALATLYFPGKCVRWNLDSLDEASALGGRIAGKLLLRVQLTVTPKAHFEVYGTLRSASFDDKHVDFVQRLDRFSNETTCLPDSSWQKVCMCKPELLNISSTLQPHDSATFDGVDARG